MSADSGGMSGSADSGHTFTPSDTQSEDQIPVMEEEDWSEGTEGRDCVVCQNAAVNRVLLPCRHACMCDSCVSFFQHCPICRAFVQESFALTQSNDCQWTGEDDRRDDYKDLSPVWQVFWLAADQTCLCSFKVWWLSLKHSPGLCSVTQLLQCFS